MSLEMRSLKIEPVCSLPPGCTANAVTLDGHVLALCPQGDRSQIFCWDGACGQPFGDVLELRDKSPAIFASTDGEHIAYVAWRGERGFVGRDRGEDPPFEAVSFSVPPVFAGNGRHLAYVAKPTDDDFRLMLDGEVVGTAKVAPLAAVFSPAGDRFAYVEMRGEGRDDVEYRIVLDDQPGEWFLGMRNAAGAMQFSPDGMRFAYYTVDGKGHARWVVDGIGQRLINDVRPMGLAQLRGVGVLDAPLPARFSPDSRRFAYAADVVEKGVALIEDDVPGPLFKGVGVPVFSPDSRHLAYTAETYSKSVTALLDGAVVGEWPATGGGLPVFSADSQHVAFPLEREERGLLRKRRLFSAVIDGQRTVEEPGDDAAAYPTWSPNSDRIAWWLRRGDQSMLVTNGVVQHLPWSVASDIRFDPLGRPVYVARTHGSVTVVVDDRLGPPADDLLPLERLNEAFGRDPWATASVPFRISADGHVAWAGVIGGRNCPVWNDEVGPGFDAIVGCEFDKGGTAVWWAQREDTVSRVERASEAA